MDSDSGVTKRNPCPRRQLPPIKVWVNESERQVLSHRAAQTGLSLSAYLKVAGLNHSIRAQANGALVKDLVQVNADLGTLADQLQVRLGHSSDSGQSAKGGEPLLQLRQAQDALRAIMARLIR